MFSQMLNDKYLKDVDGASEYIDRIIASSSRMTKLINDLLSFSRLSVNSFFEPVNINAILEEVLSDLELAIQEKQALVHVADFPIIEAIPGQMRQVFQNIVSNALKFTKKDTQPVINIEAVRVKEKKINSQPDDQGAYLRIKISDNGIGFDEQFRDKIFTIFQRLHTKQQYEGTGIGLAICKKIVDKHNGIISAHGRENEGATFIIVLPLSQTKH
jgi:two-component system CheB/CheR fusion protein